MALPPASKAVPLDGEYHARVMEKLGYIPDRLRLSYGAADAVVLMPSLNGIDRQAVERAMPSVTPEDETPFTVVDMDGEAYKAVRAALKRNGYTNQQMRSNPTLVQSVLRWVLLNGEFVDPPLGP